MSYKIKPGDIVFYDQGWYTREEHKFIIGMVKKTYKDTDGVRIYQTFWMDEPEHSGTLETDETIEPLVRLYKEYLKERKNGRTDFSEGIFDLDE